MRRYLCLIAALVATLTVVLAGSAVARSKVYRHGQRGIAHKVTRVHADLTTTAATTSRPTNITDRPKPRAPGRAAQTRAPRATGGGLRLADPNLLANFNGTSSLDSAVTNFGQEFEPPDQGLCVGNGFVLEPVNSAYNIYRTDGTKVLGPFNVNDPFDEGAKEFTSDPRCQYDKATKRWFATILFLNSSFTAGRVDIAVSQTSDPTGLWNNYSIDTTTGYKGDTCPCFGDQPRLGIDPYNIYISTDEFSILGTEFFGSHLYAVSKSDLVSGGATAHFVHFGGLEAGGSEAFGIQPAITSGTPSAEYFLSSLDPNVTFDNRLAVWAMTNRQNIADGVMPTLSNTIASSEPYALPPAADQKGSDSQLDSGDDRMQQTQYIAGTIWGELDTSVTLPNNDAPRAGAAWFQVIPRLNGALIGSARVYKQGYVALTNNYVLYPALQATPNGNAAMIFTLSSVSRFPSIGYATKPKAASDFGPVTLADSGRTNYDPNAGRWGDYSWAVMDPSGTSVWGATEYVPPASSQTTDGRRNWGTRVLNISTAG